MHIPDMVRVVRNKINKTPVEYKVVDGHIGWVFENEVGKYLADGWELQGGVSCTADQNRVVCTQALVKKG